jgi:hypothetical protein
VIKLSPQLSELLVWARRNWIWLSLATLAALVLGFVVARGLSAGERTEGTPAALEQGSAVDGPAVVAPSNQLGGPAASPSAAARPGAPSAVDAGAPLSATVRVKFGTYPPRRASVTWGGKRLGFADRGKPLIVERPRDSGPLDVVIRAPGYLPVYTRAYTFNDSTVEVRITPVDKKDTIYGYREPLPPDAGAPL